MKLKNYIQFCLAAVILTGCSSLDITNTTSYDAESVWKDERLASAYLTNLYPIVFGNWSNTADNTSEQINGITGENAVTITNGSFKCWKYTSIRKINEGLQSLDASSLDATFKLSMKSQLLFMRAYEYFQMVMYHGGVPIIKVPQDKDKDSLYVPRSSTKKCFDFIIGDIDEAIVGLPESIDGGSADYGRIDQCFAKAFKAKVLLYKASPQFNPKKPHTNDYINEAYAAAKEAYEFCKNHGKALTPDYNDIWLKERGSEVIFAVVNEYPNKIADWDNGTRPGSESRSNTWANPTWEMAKEFPMADGKKWNDPSGKYYREFTNDSIFAQSYWMNRDPRFASCLAINGSIYELSGKAGRRQYTSLGIAVSDDSFGYNPNAGVAASHNDTYTGQFIRKIQKISLTQAEVSTQYDVDFILMRFAEVMLIYAEMANEIGETTEALDILKQIRQRAGIEPGADSKYGITADTPEDIREAILDERAVELCFEGHRFWDLRRTRHLDRLDGLTKHGIEAIPYDKQQKKDMDLTKAYELSKSYSLTSEDFRYVIHQVPKVGETTMVMKDSYYFFPIQQSHIDSNTEIKQNKDWGGDFDPTLE